MDITISTHHLGILLEQAAEMGAKLALCRCGQLKPYLKKSEAYRLYGRKNVERWIESGLLKPRKDGDYSAAWRLERMELEAICKADAVLIYL
jgi:hypothetical protein